MTGRCLKKKHMRHYCLSYPWSIQAQHQKNTWSMKTSLCGRRKKGKERGGGWGREKSAKTEKENGAPAIRETETHLPKEKHTKTLREQLWQIRLDRKQNHKIENRYNDPKTETHKKCKTIVLHNTFSSAARPQAFPGLVGSKYLPVLETSEKRERWRNLDVMLEMSAKQRRDPCSEPPKDSTNYRKCVFEFPFILIDKRHNGFFNRQIMARSRKSWYSGGDPEQGFRRYFVDGLNQGPVVRRPISASLTRVFLSCVQKHFLG